MIKRGPVDVIVMASAKPHFDGKVYAELKRQSAAGVIRVLDALVLAKDESGKPWKLDFSELPADQKDALPFLSRGTHGLFDEEDAAVLFEGMAPGSAIFALAIEHVWAVPLVQLLEEEGAEVAVNQRIPAKVVSEAFETLSVAN